MTFKVDGSRGSIALLVKTFILSALISATLAKLGEAVFSRLWLPVSNSDLLHPYGLYEQLWDARELTFLVFILYLIITLARHLGAMFAVPLLVKDKKEIEWLVDPKQKMLLSIDVALTFIMFLVHYVVAYGGSEAVRKSDGLTVNLWPVATLIPLQIALVIDILICIIGMVLAKKALKKFPSSAAFTLINGMNLRWAIISLIEIVLISIALWISSFETPPLIPLSACLIMCALDFIFTREYWKQLSVD